MLLKFMETLLVALVGGEIFDLLHLPLSWMLGSLTSTMIWSLAVRRNLFWPAKLRDFGLIILGYMIGITFTPETGFQIIKQLPSMMFATLSIVLFSLLVGYITYRYTGVSLVTSIIGNVPGGLTQMTFLSEEIPDADLTAVTLMQTLRLLATVFIIPFIVTHGLTGNSQQAVASNTTEVYNSVINLPWNALLFTCVVLLAAWVARRISMPTPFLLGPLLGSAALAVTGLVQAPATPSVLVFISQLCMGTYLGLSMKPAGLGNWKRLLPITLGGSIIVVFFTLGVGYLLTYLHSLDLLSAFLCTSPGGTGEMGLTAVLVGANVSMVAAYQLFRLLFINFIVPFLLRWRFGSVQPKSKGVC